MNVGENNYLISADRVAEAMGIQQPIAADGIRDTSWIQNLLNDDPLQEELADSVITTQREMLDTQDPKEPMPLENGLGGRFERNTAPSRLAAGMKALRIWVRKLYIKRDLGNNFYN